MNDDTPFQNIPSDYRDQFARAVHDNHEETKISSFFMLCTKFVERFLQDLPSSNIGKLKTLFLIHVKGFGDPNRSDLDYCRRETVPENFDYEPKILVTEEPLRSHLRLQNRATTWIALKRADDLSRLLVGEDEVPYTLIIRLLGISSFVYLEEMADYAEMSEKYGLKYLQKILSTITELRTGLDPKNPDNLHSYASIAILTIIEAESEQRRATKG